MKKILLILGLIILVTSLPLSSLVAKTIAGKSGVYQAVLIPKPQKVIYSNTAFELNTQTVIVADRSNIITAQYLQSELQRLYGITCRVLQNVSQRDNGNQINLQIIDNSKSVPDNNEGYILTVGKDQVSVKSRNAAGVFYGIQTLKQLLHQTESGIVAQGCEITDQPALAWRGVYLNLRSIDRDPVSIQAMKNLINTFASLKMNTLFFEIADNIQFERQQFPSSASHALTKAQASDLVDYAKTLHFEVIPTIQMLSHAVWVMSNPQNIDLLEGKQTAGWATAWCPTNPGVDKLAKDMLEETIEIFHPKYFHICMDEVNYGPYHECETCKLENPSALFLKSITRMHDIMAAKGVKTIMWHDTLLPTGQYMTGTQDKVRGWEIVDKLPKDIIIADWDYGNFDKVAQKRLRYFTRKGFKVLGATFSSPTDIQSLANGLHKESSTLGLFDTLWYYANIWTRPETMAPEAWAAITLTAQYAWNPTTPRVPEITYDPVYEISRILRPVQSDIGKWSPVPLTTYFNYRISDSEESWPGYGKENSLQKVFSQDITCGQVIFQLAENGTAKNVILLSGQPDDALPVGPVTVSFNRKARRLAFLTTCNVPLNKDSLSTWSHATEQPLVGKYTMEYEDGSTADMELLYRWNISDWNYKLGVFDGHIAYTGETENSSRVQLIRTDWVNPYPGKSIKNITITSLNQDGMSLAIFAISADAQQEN